MIIKMVELIIDKKNITIICEVNRNKLIDSNKLGCIFKIFKSCYGRHKIIIDIKNYSFLIDIINKLFLIINNNFDTHNINFKIYYLNKNLLNIIIQLNKFINITHINFGKKTNINSYFLQMKNLSGVKEISIVSRKYSNLTFLPDNLEKLNLSSNKIFKIYNIPKYLKKISFGFKRFSSTSINIDLSNMLINKILFINSDIINYNDDLIYDKIDYDEVFNCDCLCYSGSNDITNINLTNLSDKIKLVYVCTSLNFSIQNKDIEINNLLENLPNSVIKIIFDGTIDYNLSNLPSSVKKIDFLRPRFDYSKIFNQMINQIPDFVEEIYIDNITYPKNKDDILIDKLPKKLKKIIINKKNEYLCKVIHQYNKLNPSFIFDMI